MDSWVLCPCQRSRLDLLKRMLESLDHSPDHVVIVATFPDPLTKDELNGYADSVVLAVSLENHISRWWNLGLDYIASMARTRHEVLSLSSDYVGAVYSVALLAATMRQHNLTMIGPDHHSNELRIFRAGEQRHAFTRVPGACWMLAGESGLRVDEQFRWWYSDDDLEMQARQRSGAGVVPGAGLVGGPDTELSDEKLRWAREDRAKFIQKWKQEPW